MSRVGKYPVEIKDGVTVSIENNEVVVKGKLGEQRVAIVPSAVTVKIEDNKVIVAPVKENDKFSTAMWGTTRANINNAVVGVSEGFTKELELKGVGYKAQLQGNALNLSLAFSHEVIYKLPEGVKAECPSATEIKLTSADKQLVGQVASEIRAYRKPEPYKGKGIRYKGEYVRRKEGKKK
ncbi:MAG: 50S ribosomal protein L6 [Alphaproteobacteria bacterium]|jgi:large subunit ribosomal protein L6|nr:50S ribosomal protein L6 [Alphaproteobacteria bacterium]